MIKETCSCGATFEMTPTQTGYTATVVDAAAKWRKDHKHDQFRAEHIEQMKEEIQELKEKLRRQYFDSVLATNVTPNYPDAGCSYCGSEKHIARECPDA